MAVRGKVHADLVGAAGGEAAFQERDGGVEDFQGSVAGERCLAAVGDEGHALAVLRVPADGALDFAFGGFGDGPYEGFVGAFDIPGGEGGGEGGEGLLGLGDDHHAGGVAVKAVDDAGPAFAADAGEFVSAMGEERVHQGAVFVAGGGVDDEAGGLVQHDEVAVFVQDGEGDGLGLGGGVDDVRRGEFVGAAGADRVGRLGDENAVPRGVAGFDEVFDAGARDCADGFGEVAVRALAGGFLGGDQSVGFGHHPGVYRGFWGICAGFTWRWVC